MSSTVKHVIGYIVFAVVVVLVNRKTGILDKAMSKVGL